MDEFGYLWNTKDSDKKKESQAQGEQVKIKKKQHEDLICSAT